MTKMLADGNVKVTFAPTVADIAAPKAATELGAAGALDLQCLITADGLNISAAEAVVSLPQLCDTVDSEGPGRVKYGIDLTFYRHVATVDDKAWETIDRLLEGFLAIRYGTAHDAAWAAADKALMFDGTFGALKPLPTEAGGGVKFACKFYVDAVDLKAVAAA